jgi:hypothetical protein
MGRKDLIIWRPTSPDFMPFDCRFWYYGMSEMGQVARLDDLK